MKLPRIFSLTVLLILFLCNWVFPENELKTAFVNDAFSKANTLYEQEKFDLAVKKYEEIINAGYESASIYYNLGNAYFKTGAVGKAILNYERAKRLMPNDSDLLTNISYAKSLVVDRAIQAPAPWFINMVNSLPERFSAERLYIWIFIINVLIFAFLTINVFKKRKSKFLFFIAAVLIVIFIAGFVALGKKVSVMKNNEEAIIILPETECRFGPADNATAHFKLYEGSKITILKTEAEWSKVKRFDDKIGWVKKDSYGLI